MRLAAPLCCLATTSRALIAPARHVTLRRTRLHSETQIDNLERSWNISRDPERSELYQETLATAAAATAACWALALVTLALSPPRRTATAAKIGARLAAARGWRGVAATWLAGTRWVAAPPLAGALLALGARGVRSGVGMRTERWHRLATAPLAVAFLPLAVVLYLDAELSARLPLTSNEMDGGSLLMRCAFGACIPFFLLFAVGANVVRGARRLVRRPPPSD